MARIATDTPADDRDYLKPFVKWAGGKGQLVPQLLRLSPRRFKVYREPFAGGGAFFFAMKREGRLDGKKAFLSDINSELIATYRAIQDDVDAVIEQLRRHKYEREHYYRVRDRDPARLDPPARAARMIFLNKSGFNGLYRVNRQGKFNVPFGRHKGVNFQNDNIIHNLKAVSRALQEVTIDEQPFENIRKTARKGDFVYFDPPYDPVSDTAYFVNYAKNGFGQAEQIRLAGVFAELADRGVKVMLSNSDTERVRQWYDRFHIESVQARRFVNSRADRRGPVGEVVVVGGYDLEECD